MGSWDGPAKYGLTTVASAAINETWTAIRLKPAGQSKVSEFRNEAVKQNEYAVFIDLKNRQINLPPDLKESLELSPNALAFYHGLSFSNKREYVVWVLSAKQRATRAARLTKTVEKLLSGKKNPSEK